MARISKPPEVRRQEILDTAMEQYVRECCAAGLPIIHDRSRTIRQRLDDMAALTLETEQNARYHAFYHRPENQHP